MKNFLVALALCAGPGLALAQSAGPPIPNDSTVKVVKVPKGFTSQLNAVYVQTQGWDGRMDLYTNPNSAKPTPVLVHFHGGGWNHGTKESQSGFSAYLKHGYAVANVEYRLTPQATAPAAVQDARCALIYLITNAKKLNIDPNKIILEGTSSGAHLALVAGLLENSHTFDVNCTTTEPVRVAAIVDNYGIADVDDWQDGRLPSKSATRWLGKYADNRKFIRSVSPVYLVQKTSPPVFIIHGDADPTVPYEQSTALHKKLQEMGVKTQLITVPGGLHGKFTREQKTEQTDAILAFLDSLGI